jgi:predicted kinase
LGQSVVADSVNPLTATREAWRAVAASANFPIIEVEIICSDLEEHRRRVESRISASDRKVDTGFRTNPMRKQNAGAALPLPMLPI